MTKCNGGPTTSHIGREKVMGCLKIGQVIDKNAGGPKTDQ
mgnify:FL=1